jgi:biopolymer transport protein ExbD
VAGGSSSTQYEDDEGGAGAITDINVTPLVDITLVLLIIFMVTAPMIVNNPSIKVELPKAATGDETLKSTLALTLSRDPSSGAVLLYANGEKSDEAAVKTMIPAMLTKNKELQAIIAADRGISYGDVVHIVDLVKSLGVHKFALNTDPNP